MRFRILTALSLSGLLILGAGFLRFKGGANPHPALVAIETIPAATTTDPAFAATDSTDLVPEAEPQNLNTTDLVSRQMLSDYMDMAVTGQTTEDNINTLADKYVESAPSLIESDVINATDVNIIQDSPGAFQAYANALDKLTAESSASANSIDYASAVTSAGTDVAGLSTKLADSYDHAATALRGMTVPSSLLNDHIELTNMYLSDAAALRSLAQVDSDPTVAFSGMAKYNENLKAEDPIIADMIKILKDHGIN